MEETDIRKSLTDLLSALTGARDIEIRQLAQSGSNRSYYRLKTGNDTYIGTFVPDPAEGKCFVGLAKGFGLAGRSVPKIYAVSEDCRLYIQEDLGNLQLFSTLSSPDASAYVRDAIKKLVELQKTPEKYWVDDCMARPFSRRQAMWDLNYFKYEYLRPQETVYDEEKLEDDFELLCDRLISIPVQFQGFMMRDCQSRNVMITEEGPVFIDFQGGRKGPVLYDAVSMLWQARAGFDKKFRDIMLDFYCTEFTGGNELQKKEMLSFLNDIVLFRTLQVLGAYGFRGLVQHKAHFLLSIPGALANLRELLVDGALDSYPELKRCAVSLTSGNVQEDKPDGKNLTVEIFSFSYKKGYPQDLSGNGGGFMFDCRAMHNPGRYAQYRDLTGRDQAVVDFLEVRGEIGHFLRNAWALIDPAIERYVARGFTRLQVGFGCTGGQHRSVYSAERTAAHVREIFPEVSVRLIHREHPDKKV